MLNLKKTAGAVLLASSGVVFAGTMGPVCSAVNVTVPCESTAWDFGGKAIYLQPTLSNNTLTTQRTITNNGVVTTAGQNPPYSWGFFLEGSYHFNTGNDVNLNWYHLTRSTTRTLSNADFLPSAARPADMVAGSTGSISVNPKWDAVNLEVGQHVDFGESKSIRFHGGFQYARLVGNTSSSAPAVPVTGRQVTTADIQGTFNPTYNGFGPRLGADMAYDWGNGLGIYANGAAAVLAGSSKYNNNMITTTTLATTTMNTSGSSTMIVPELEAKLGGTYTYAMAQGDLTLDAGWMWVNYFNATQSDSYGLTPAQGDFGLQGPFVGLKWLGNVA